MRTCLAIMILSFFCTVSVKAGDNSCLLEKYTEYAKAQKQWQLESTQLIRQHKPELSKVADIYMNDQLVLIEQDLLAVKLLLSSRPESVNTHKSINEWLNLNKEEEQALAKSNKRYKELLSIAAAAKRRPPHPDGDKLRAAMRSEIMLLPEFQDLLSRFNEKIKEIDSRVCNDS